MSKTLSEMMANFAPEEQAEIQAEANQLIAEEITLRELHKAYHCGNKDKIALTALARTDVNLLN